MLKKSKTQLVATDRGRVNKLLFIVGSTLASANWTFDNGMAKIAQQNSKYDLQTQLYSALIHNTTASAMYGLTVELSLKLIIELSTAKCARHSHDLVVLYSDVPTGERSLIRESVGKCYPTLKANRSSFEDWRYFHDESPKNERVHFNKEFANKFAKHAMSRHAVLMSGIPKVGVADT